MKKFTNYYDVLRLPDDYFPETIESQLDSISISTSPSDRETLFNEAFNHDLQLELACLLGEMEDMVEHVYETYCEVKREQRTLVEATAVSYAAMLLTQSRVATLQLRYPSICQAQDVLTLLDDQVTKNLPTKLAQALCEMDSRHTIDHMPGLFLADFVWVGSALMIPPRKTKVSF